MLLFQKYVMCSCKEYNIILTDDSIFGWSTGSSTRGSHGLLIIIYSNQCNELWTLQGCVCTKRLTVVFSHV